MLNYGNMQPYQAQNIPNYYHTQNVQIRPIMQNPVIMPNPVTMPSQVIIQNPVIKANPVNIQNPVIMQNPVNFKNPVIMQKPVMMPNYVIAPNQSNMQTFHNLQNMQMIPKIPNNQKIVSQADFVDCNKAVPINIIIKALKSICKIAIRGNSNVNATGFFMKISDTQKYLITNYHVINQNNIYDNIEIEIHNQKKMKLNLNNREVKYFPKPKDITMIEIKTSDNIYNDILFLDYDLNYQKGYYIYQNAIIFLIQHPNGKNAEYAPGKIININNFEFDHNIGTKSGASGSPIILFNENIDSIQVIGIHKEANFIKNLNTGTFIGEIFNKEKYNIPKNNNKYSFNNYLTNTNHMFSGCSSLTNINLSNFNTQMPPTDTTIVINPPDEIITQIKDANEEKIYEYITENDCEKGNKIKVTFMNTRESKVIILINPNRTTEELVKYFFKIIQRPSLYKEENIGLLINGGNIDRKSKNEIKSLFQLSDEKKELKIIVADPDEKLKGTILDQIIL